MTKDNSKIKITEEEYNLKIRNTTGSAIYTAVFTSIAVAGGVPYILWKLKRIIPLPIEVRAALGLLPSLPAGYFSSLYRRTRNLEEIERKYTY